MAEKGVEEQVLAMERLPIYSICQLLNLPYTEHYFSLCNNPFKLYNCFHLISIIFYLIE